MALRTVLVTMSVTFRVTSEMYRFALYKISYIHENLKKSYLVEVHSINENIFCAAEVKIKISHCRKWE